MSDGMQSSGMQSEPKKHFSIAQYKWIRDLERQGRANKKVLDRVDIFVCSECSLDFSNTLLSTHNLKAAASLAAKPISRHDSWIGRAQHLR